MAKRKKRKHRGQQQELFGHSRALTKAQKRAAARARGHVERRASPGRKTASAQGALPLKERKKRAAKAHRQRQKVEIEPFRASIDELVEKSKVGGKNARYRIQRQGRFKKAIGPTWPMKMAQLLRLPGFSKASTHGSKAFGPSLPPAMRLARASATYRKNKCHSLKTGLVCRNTLNSIKSHTKALKRQVNRL